MLVGTPTSCDISMICFPYLRYEDADDVLSSASYVIEKLFIFSLLIIFSVSCARLDQFVSIFFLAMIFVSIFFLAMIMEGDIAALSS